METQSYYQIGRGSGGCDVLYVEDDLPTFEAGKKRIQRIGKEMLMETLSCPTAQKMLECLCREMLTIKMILTDHNLDKGVTSLKIIEEASVNFASSDYPPISVFTSEPESAHLAWKNHPTVCAVGDKFFFVNAKTKILIELILTILKCRFECCQFLSGPDKFKPYKNEKLFLCSAMPPDIADKILTLLH
jgi:hypothetical protein